MFYHLTVIFNIICISVTNPINMNKLTQGQTFFIIIFYFLDRMKMNNPQLEESYSCKLFFCFFFRDNLELNLFPFLESTTSKVGIWLKEQLDSVDLLGLREAAF